MASRAMILFLLILAGAAALAGSYNILFMTTMTSLQHHGSDSDDNDIFGPSINMVSGLFLRTFSESHHHHHPHRTTNRQEKPFDPGQLSSRLDDDGEETRPNLKTMKQRKRLFHVALTSSDSPYNQWQCRIMYYWYRRFRDQAGSEMGGFTRILHSGRPDDLMDEIPTSVVEELPAGMDQGYVVLNRPWAFVQWLQNAAIEEEYIMMAEPDHMFLRPLPNLAAEDAPAAYPFFYINATKFENVIRKFYPEKMGPISSIDPIGNSPAIIKKSQLEKIASTWMNISLQMKADSDADKSFGWVLEMYAYAVASARHGIRHTLRKDFMIQPPWDADVGDAYIIHYTYGCDYTMKGVLTYGKIGEWRFDKRSYLLEAPPRNLPLPPPGVPESVVTLVKMINEATSNLPRWKE